MPDGWEVKNRRWIGVDYTGGNLWTLDPLDPSDANKDADGDGQSACEGDCDDDNPEITAYLQVQDLTNKDKDDVYVFNGWMFSSSPSIRPFDHPVYDIWLVNCY